LLVFVKARLNLPAIAPRGPEAYALRVDQHHVQPALGGVQRRRQTGVATTDHTQVAARLAPQGRKRL